MIHAVLLKWRVPVRQREKMEQDVTSFAAEASDDVRAEAFARETDAACRNGGIVRHSLFAAHDRQTGVAQDHRPDDNGRDEPAQKALHFRTIVVTGGRGKLGAEDKTGNEAGGRGAADEAQEAYAEVPEQGKEPNQPDYSQWQN